MKVIFKHAPGPSRKADMIKAKYPLWSTLQDQNLQQKCSAV